MPRIPAGMRKTVRGTYESRFTIHGKRYSVYGKTVKECKEKELARRQEIEEGLRYSGRELTLDQYFLKWEQDRQDTSGYHTCGPYFRPGICLSAEDRRDKRRRRR